MKTERTSIFRTWDKNNLQVLHMPAVNIDFGAWWKEHCPDNSVRENEIVLMQFTGVYDHYHKEIFEGDIVLYHSPSDTDERAVVHYLTGYACFGVRADIPLRTIPHLEVVGNIFENPEDVPDACFLPIRNRTDTLLNVGSGKTEDPTSHQ